MKKFFIGMATGIVAGGGMILAVHPMSKREMKKACKKAGKLMHKLNCSLRSDEC